MDAVTILHSIFIGLIAGSQFADFYTLQDIKKDIKDLQEKVKDKEEH